jgi:hypothetical protein
LGGPVIHIFDVIFVSGQSYEQVSFFGFVFYKINGDSIDL